MTESLYALFKRNFPYVRREEETARDILSNPENQLFFHKDNAGNLVGAAVVHKNTLLLLCVDAPFRNTGVGSKLLAEAETYVKSKGYKTITIGVGD
ncbi:MAG: GNAT family N-acetyltransferase, partial [Clostridia bacterium]|nr:GNAT family N-acetyltransferase [Clostridia bacterium]